MSTMLLYGLVLAVVAGLGYVAATRARRRLPLSRSVRLRVSSAGYLVVSLIAVIDSPFRPVTLAVSLVAALAFLVASFHGGEKPVGDGPTQAVDPAAPRGPFAR